MHENIWLKRHVQEKQSTLTCEGGKGGRGGGVAISFFSASGSGWTKSVVREVLSSSFSGSGPRSGHWPISAFSNDTGWAKSIGLRRYNNISDGKWDQLFNCGFLLYL